MSAMKWRDSARLRASNPPNWRYQRPLLAPCLCGCSEKAS